MELTTIEGVLCSADLTTNLLSVSQLINNGNTVKFDDNSCKIYNKQNNLVGIAHLIDGIYKLEIEKTVVENPEYCLFTSMVATSEIWHRRFGHINSRDLNKLRNNGLVEGLSFPGNAEIEKKNCVVCCEGKQTRLPFSQSGSRAKVTLEIVHADLCGPMEVTSIGGSKYFLILEDDFTRMAFVYFVKAKDEVFECFRSFKHEVENQKGKRIKVLRTDNGGEFCSREFEKFLKENGIIHQKTNPYTPEQNGSAERLNRTIVEKARFV